ncbi:MAG: hypothetical protein PHP23_01570 [Desulfobacterales bacterium]|nr:hypothetical protein [Desulfobacterales bacterium]MDD4071362.1 hypothetical protein [Desulfobacterales bacterium]MDD4392666.1 hypothetical protein [Desulfobacterales bacterium]
MSYWCVREDLSQANRLRRSYYELLRDEIDQFMLQHALIDSYQNFQKKNLPYPFVEKRELKPRARIPDVEYESQNTFLVIFVEDSVPAMHKKYIRFFDVNQTNKTNLLRSKTLLLNQAFDRNQKYLENVQFPDFLKSLLPVDYALLIQRDPASRIRDRYALSHFHVRIDWPISEAAEDLAKNLRYISKDLYEKGDKYAEDIQKKFFEYYGLPLMAGGRRTAAIVAAQYLRKIPCISTVYAGSSEARAVFRISERWVAKSVLMKLTADNIAQILDISRMTLRTFRKHYVVAWEGKEDVCIFQATYTPTIPARPPEDGKLREIKADLNWLTVDSQYIMPKPGTWKYPPISLNLIYT